MKFLDYLFGRKPAATRSSLRGHRHEPPAIAQTMDASRISDLLRSAEAGDMADFFALARDIVSGHGHTLTEFGKRKLAVLAESQSFPPKDADNAAEVARGKEIESQIDGLPCWMTAMLHLLDSTLYPVSVLQKVYRVSSRPGWRYELADLIPVPYHLLDFSTGALRIKDVGSDGAVLGTTHFPEPIRYVIHRGHLLTSCPDTWGGPMRAILFWWLFATQGRDWWARFLERFGAPFLEGTYDKNDDESRMMLEQAFSAATRLFGIAVPDDASVKIHQANSSQGGDAFKQFADFAHSQISLIIVGQDSAGGKNAGISGDGQARAQENVRTDIRQFDSIMLASTVRTQILIPLCQINGWTGEPPRVAWGGDDSEDLKTISEVLESLYKCGWELTEEGGDSFAKRLALPLQRLQSGAPLPGPGQPPATTPPAPGQLSALAAPSPATALSMDANRAVDAIARRTADPFAAAMSLTIEPLATLVSRSTSLADLEARLIAAIPGLDTSRASRVAEAALTASSANAGASADDA